MVRVLLAVNDGRLLDHLYGIAAESAELTIAGTVRDPQELRTGIGRSDIDAVIVHDSRGSVPLIELTRELSVSHPDLGLVLLVGEGSPEILRSGMQAGARDVLAHPVTLDQLDASVLAAASWTQALRRRAARDAGGELLGVGRIITVVGSKGGVGTTTVATHLAMAAAELGTASVSLIEYDLYAGDLRAFLDLPYRRSVVDLVPVAAELTARNLQESMFTHSSGVRVLLGPEQAEDAEQVAGDVARNILSAVRTREDLTIVDAGATLSEASSVAVEMADTVIIVATPDVVALRGVSRMCSMWDRLGVEPQEVAVLLNKTSRKLEIQPELARRVIPVPLMETTVAADFGALEGTVNTGIPSAAAASDAMLKPMASVLGELSAVGPADQRESRASRSRSIAARLAGESGQATVEFTGVLPLFVILFLVAWQVVLVGATFVFAGHAARSGAAALAIGDPVASAAGSGVPGSWQQNLAVSDHTDSQGNGTVDVSVGIPLLFPGSVDLGSIHSSARTVIEDELLQGETSPLTLLGGGGGGEGGLPVIVPAQLTPGDTATMINQFTATAPIDAPPIVKEMIAAANAISHYTYCFGGGHDPEFAPSTGTTKGADGDGTCSAPTVGYDCSGATSFILHAAGLLNAPEDSSAFESFGQPGPGKWVTIWSTAGHVHIVIAGLNFDTIAGQMEGGGGGSWAEPSYPTGDYAADGFVATHPTGL